MAEKRRFCFDDPSDVTQIHQFLFDHDEEMLEENGDECETDSEDHVEEREGDSSSEQDCGSSDEEDEDETSLLSKDKKTKWSTKVPNSRIRRGNSNILRHLPGSVGEAKNASTPYESWKCIFTDDLLEMIVNNTNIYINKIKERFKRERDAHITDIVELKAFIGLLYHIGVLRSNRQSLEELWGEDGDGIERFRLVMSLKRFKFLIRCTRFDNIYTREERRSQDKLAPAREMFEMFIKNCQKSFSVGEDVTIDEKLEGFRGRCSFRQYIPSKPNKYGIKIYALADSKTFYSYNLEVYCGKQPDGPYSVSNKPKDVVIRLAQPLFGTGRNITCDNWFSSLGLLQHLKEKKLSLLGTIRKNKPELPPQLVNTKSRSVKSSKFCFSKDCSLVSFIPKKGKNVLAISSMHFDNEVDKDTGKPEIIMKYNSTKGGVDVVDKLGATYNVARNVRRWSMVLFFALLNVAGVNSQIILLSNFNLRTGNKRRLYLKTLAKELCLEQLQRRSQMKLGIPIDLQKKLHPFIPPGHATIPEHGSELSCNIKRKSCVTCQETAKKRRLSKYYCQNCVTVFVCLEHAKIVCEKCFNSVIKNISNQEDAVNE